MKNMIMLLSALFFLMTFTQNSSAATTQNQALLQEANSAYHEGDYSHAMTLYEQLTAENGYSGDILYNLANTYAQKGETGRAVVNYLRARLLDPSDPDIKGNLELVNKKAGLFNEEQPFFNKITTILTFNQWCDVALFSFAIFVGATAITLFLPTWNIVGKTAMPISVLLIIFSVYLAVISYHPYTSAVIIQPETALLISPHDKASTNGSIREGRLVSLIKEYNGFRYVRDSSGRAGWIPEQAVESIIPVVYE